MTAKDITLSGGSDNGPAKMTSSEIAEMVGARHDNVRVAIERLVDRGIITLPATQVKPTKGRPSIEYVFSGESGKRDSIVVVAQLSPEFTAQLVDRWQYLEAKAAAGHLHMPNFADPVAAARAWADQYEARVIAQRTKAEIGSRREATAMATASREKREADRLRKELGEMTDYAAVKRMEKVYKDKKFNWRDLKKASAELDLPIRELEDSHYGKINAYHAVVWRKVYGVEIQHLGAR